MGAIKQVNYQTRNIELYDYAELEKMTSEAFGEALQFANNHKTGDAIELAREALVYANICQSNLRINIHKFMSMVNFEMGKLNNARIHCWHALQSLSKKHKNYFEEKMYFDSLMSMIEKAIKESKSEGKVIRMH